MGACVSTCAAWKEEAQSDPEVMAWSEKQRRQQQVALPTLPADGAPLATLSLPAGGKQQPGQSQQQQQAHYETVSREGQEQAVAHLVRHPRLQPFQQQPGECRGVGRSGWGRSG